MDKLFGKTSFIAQIIRKMTSSKNPLFSVGGITHDHTIVYNRGMENPIKGLKLGRRVLKDGYFAERGL